MINITEPTVTQNDEDDGNDNHGNEDDNEKITGQTHLLRRYEVSILD